MAKTDGLVNEEFFEYADYIGHKIARLNDLLDAHVNIPNTIHNFQEYLEDSNLNFGDYKAACETSSVLRLTKLKCAPRHWSF